MNKAFKVLWNHLRGSYVVASEATASHGKASKAVKTTVAVAVMAATGMSAAIADPVTVDKNGSVLVSGNGQGVNVETSGSVGTLLGQLQADHGLSGILKALTGENAQAVTLVTGGSNWIDQGGLNTLLLVTSDVTLMDKFNRPDADMKDTLVTIGGEGKQPVVIGSIGADLALNLGLTSHDEEPERLLIDRTGSSITNLESGNTFGIVGSSLAVNVSVLTSNKDVLGSTTTTLNGNTYLNINSGANAAGAFGAGAALAVGGSATSNVYGTSNITIQSTVDAKNLEGLSVGLFGGGLSAATSGGTATTSVGGTNIVIGTEKGEGLALGTIGGGAAVVTDPSVVTSVVGNDGLGGLVGRLLGTEGGTAMTTVSGPTNIIANKNSTTALLMGGGMAVANFAADDATTNGNSVASAISTDIRITLDGAATSEEVFGDKPEDETNKLAFHTAAENFYGYAQGVLDQLTTDKPFDLQGAITGLQDAVKDLNVHGVHVGNLGGGIAVARSTGDGTATAEANATSVLLEMKGGYNVASMAGGIAVAWGNQDSKADATAYVGETTVNISAGENILVAGGGAAYATAGNGQTSPVNATTTVTKATIGISGGKTDGVYGGGIAIDDTNSSDSNAFAETAEILIDVSGGEVNEANTSIITKFVNGDVSSEGNPSRGALVKDMVDLIDKGDVAILGGGMASGAGAEATTTISSIKLTGGRITGSVFGGGAATFSGKSVVDDVTISVDGATVEQDIYAGGLAGSPRNDGTTGGETGYQNAYSEVGEATISLVSGTVNGNIYASGFVYDNAQTGPESVVKNATIVLESDQVFKGDLIDGSGTTNSSTLSILSSEYSFGDGQEVKGFDIIDANGTTTGLNYEFADNKSTTKVLGGAVEFVSLTNVGGKTLQVGDADGRAGLAVITGGALTSTEHPISDLTMQVDKGMLAFNTDAATAEEVASSAPLSASAKAFVAGTVNFGSTKVLVGEVGADLATDNGLYVGSNGMLVADASGTTEVQGSTSFAEGSSIHFVNVSETGSVTVSNTANVGTTVDNVLYTVSLADNRYTFAQRTADQLDEVGLGGIDLQFLDGLDGQDNPGAEYISGFLNEVNSGVNNSNREQQLKAAMNLATAAGVQTMAIDGTMMGIEAANKRASIINNFVDGGKLFAELTGKHSEMGGGSGFGEIESDLGGLVVGGEYTTNDWTFGALANLGTGSVDGKGNNANVENDVDYYGIQAYAGKRFGQFNLVGQVGYLMSENDISHSTIGSNTADVDADVWTIGLRGEMRFELSDTARMVPYVGVNYLRVSTDGYTSSQGVKVDDIDQNLWTTPVGVKFAGDFESASGWVWSPSVDVAYIPAFGDTDVDATTDVGVVGRTSMDVWSDSVGRAKLGISAQKDNLGIGLEIGGAAGADDFTEYFGQVRVDYRF